MGCERVMTAAIMFILELRLKRRLCRCLWVGSILHKRRDLVIAELGLTIVNVGIGRWGGSVVDWQGTHLECARDRSCQVVVLCIRRRVQKGCFCLEEQTWDCGDTDGDPCLASVICVRSCLINGCRIETQSKSRGQQAKKYILKDPLYTIRPEGCLLFQCLKRRRFLLHQRTNYTHSLRQNV